MKINIDDTITAIATPPGYGGIGIIRISGNAAFEIADAVFKGSKRVNEFSSHSVNFGHIVSEEGDVTDECILLKMDGPKSYTGENVVELQLHGGTIILNGTLSMLIHAGARIAEPGEFTKRAFLNGKMDLSQAEAVIDMINSGTKESLKVASSQLAGKLSDRIKEAKSFLINMLAHLETNADYPEYDIEELTGKKLSQGLEKAKKILTGLINTFSTGNLLKTGMKAVIAGRPNVGKSSFLNNILGRKRAIVTDLPGTTRDLIEEVISIAGVPIRLTDTAGIRKTNDEAEKIGVSLTEEAIADSDIIILIIDSSKGITDEDIKLYNNIKNKEKIIILNKTDKGLPILWPYEGDEVIYASMKKNEGIEKFVDIMEKKLYNGNIITTSEILVTEVRHKTLLEKAIEGINNALKAINDGVPMDCITIDIYDAVDALGNITGENVSEELVNEIFEKFCLGK